RAPRSRAARNARASIANSRRYAGSPFGTVLGCLSPGSMIEALEEAVGRPVSRETFDRLSAYVQLLKSEAERQNLIASSTLETIWERHVLDSAHLARFGPGDGAAWAD